MRIPYAFNRADFDMLVKEVENNTADYDRFFDISDSIWNLVRELGYALIDPPHGLTLNMSAFLEKSLHKNKIICLGCLATSTILRTIPELPSVAKIKKMMPMYDAPMLSDVALPSRTTMNQIKNVEWIIDDLRSEYTRPHSLTKLLRIYHPELCTYDNAKALREIAYEAMDIRGNDRKRLAKKGHELLTLADEFELYLTGYATEDIEEG